MAANRTLEAYGFGLSQLLEEITSKCIRDGAGNDGGG